MNPSRRKKPKTLNSPKAHIALGLSGGVDSATSAALLLSQGYRVTGVTCVFNDADAGTASLKTNTIAAAESVCRALGIDHVVYDVREVFREQVIDPFITDCAQGLTPAPCVTCNRFCKIPVLCQAADELGCEKIATGHYARVVEDTALHRFTLKRALDEAKDQTYMLSLLKQDQLSRLVLPLGGYTKQEVRQYALDQGIPVANRPESQDLCFVAGDYRDFLIEQGITDDPGPIMTRDGEVVGTHHGIHHFTLGQRKGLGVAMGEPYFVVDKDVQAKSVTIAPKDRAFISAVEVRALNWMLPCPSEPCSVKIRYRSKPALARVIPLGTDRSLDTSRSPNHQADGDPSFSAGCVRVEFFEPQALTAPGQCCAFYQGSVLIGGGIIDTVTFSA